MTNRMEQQPNWDKEDPNMFRHVVLQSIVTSIYGREVADALGDIHERQETESAITWEGEKWRTTLNFRIADTYVDLINNIYGQELGEKLKLQFNIDRDTVWSVKLTTDYLNAILDYFSSEFEYKFDRYEPENETVIQLTDLLNQLRDEPRLFQPENEALDNLSDAARGL
jgi:hypothetical protein